MCIKYGEPVKNSEKIILVRVQLKYYETVRHLGYYFNNDNNGISENNYIYIYNLYFVHNIISTT